MKRVDIISTIGRDYLKENIENGEFSYQQALSKAGKTMKIIYLRVQNEI